jgi:hypothetical protein
MNIKLKYFLGALVAILGSIALFLTQNISF